MQTSIDGFPQYGANDEQHWVIRAWDEIKNYILDLANSCDTAVSYTHLVSSVCTPRQLNLLSPVQYYPIETCPSFLRKRSSFVIL